MAFPSLPASPTLTNPDMILPYYGEYDSTPSPPQDAMRPLSPPGAWKDSRPDDMMFSIGPPAHLQMGVGPITPTTPIIYGNGTMLSDIGEVTEAESTPRRKPRESQTQQTVDRDSPLRSSPTMGYNAVIKRAKRVSIHQRTVSVESSSTVTSEGQIAGVFEDFDDGISMDDSNFQGDDEESVADESYEHQIAVAQAKSTMRNGSGPIEDGGLNSSAALSRRAELILANAKKRLDNMEGNLSRARSSLYITPSSSMSSIHSSSSLHRSTPSPPDAEHRILPQLGVPPAKHRQLNNSSSPGTPGTPGHSRVFSENSISSLYNPLQTPTPVNLSTPKPGSSEIDNKATVRPSYSTPLGRNSSAFIKPLIPLNEDDTLPSRGRDGSVRSSTAEPYFREPYLGIPDDHRGIARSGSPIHMRDLTDKMKDLKGKISSLRDRAREDTLKRRSLQSLRTPSPFTAAEQWYTSAKAYRDEGLSADAGVAQNSWFVGNEKAFSIGSDEKTNGNLALKVANYAELETPTVYEDVEEIEAPDNIDEPSVDQGNKTPPSEQGDVYETAGEDEVEDEVEVEEEVDGADEDDYVDELIDHGELDEYQSEGDASLYHDTLSRPVSHEDREDAFDYEHFFLHSAMGTLTEARLKRRDSSGSFSSEDSMETTRGPEAPPAATPLERPCSGNPLEQVKTHKSTDSVSTLASFATAAEGFEANTSETDGYGHDNTTHNVLAPSNRPIVDSASGKRSPHVSPTNIELPASGTVTPETTSRPNSVIRVGSRQYARADRPSMSSFASTGTTRSFPLVNKPKTPSPTPEPVTPAPVSGASVAVNGALNNITNDGVEQPSPVSMLIRDDQILVEGVVSSLGKCVLGLQEASRAGPEGLMWRRRLDAARRVLEGIEDAV